MPVLFSRCHTFFSFPNMYCLCSSLSLSNLAVHAHPQKRNFFPLMQIFFAPPQYGPNKRNLVCFLFALVHSFSPRSFLPPATTAATLAVRRTHTHTYTQTSATKCVWMLDTFEVKFQNDNKGGKRRGHSDDNTCSVRVTHPLLSFLQTSFDGSGISHSQHLCFLLSPALSSTRLERR